jgi:protein-glutamine gamma-glutamyltransferase
MKQPSYNISFLRLVLSLLLLVAPTIYIIYLVVKSANTFFTIPNQDIMMQALYFGSGALIAFVLYYYRVRFIITFPLLILLLYTIYKSIEKYYPGEFDSFFVSIRFMLFAILFGLGWLTGFGLARWRHFPIFLAVLIVVLHIIMLSDATDLLMYTIFWEFFPVIIYAFYIIYVRGILDNLQELRFRQFLRLVARYALFLLLLVGLFHGLLAFLEDRDPLKMIMDKVGGGGSSDSTGYRNMDNDMLRQNQNQTFSMKDYAELRSQLGRTNELLFCSYVDNFFDGTDIPNPLYFTCYYLTKYDTKKERFETDPNMPSNDLFQPDPSQIPLFFTKRDTSVIRKGMGSKMRKVINVDVYINQLAPNTYVSPSTAFSCQPITVEEDYKDMFRSAYRTQCYVSELNSAYFVYNASEQPQIQMFQQERFDILGRIKDYKEVDKNFLKYYTEVPKGTLYDSIGTLAKEITEGAVTPIEKIIRVRDYFLSKTESGEPLFVYTLTPGSPNDPNIPNASKLGYFLFTNRKGYCTYFAGSTVFLLRSLGIPTRMTAGFMTVDRSDKNKGWYWFYGDQAHAWVQVYFPGYGWLDFDTTIGADESRESSQPDGTPPIQPPKALLAATGVIEDKGDSVSKTATLSLEKMVYHDIEMQPRDPYELEIDLKHAVIKDNMAQRDFNFLKEGDQVLIVSYDEDFKKLGPRKKGQKAEDLLERFPDPVPVDEVYIKPKEEKKPEEPKQQDAGQDKKGMTRRAIYIALFALLFFAIFLPLLPLITFTIMRMRANMAKDPRKKAYSIYRLSEFLHHQLGYERNTTPLNYAEKVIDPQFDSGYAVFLRVYLKTKYSNMPLSEHDVQVINKYYPSFTRKVFAPLKRSRIFARFINFIATLNFWTRKVNDNPNDQ